MTQQNCHETKSQAPEHIQHHVEVILVFHKLRILIHEGGEGCKSATETCGQYQFGIWIHESTRPRQARQEPQQETTYYIY